MAREIITGFDLEVLELIKTGIGNKQIAEILSGKNGAVISRKEVKKSRWRLKSGGMLNNGEKIADRRGEESLLE